MNALTENIDKLHTTEMGRERIRKNLQIEEKDVVKWCKAQISEKNALFERRGKNWYVSVNNCIITVNAGSYTVITAHKY
ncbi:MAG: DUF3781 domain-containing protein [Ruminococcus sp.]|nr:DUF3781 domain-containing protein [Ruminococcus sp.]